MVNAVLNKFLVHPSCLDLNKQAHVFETNPLTTASLWSEIVINDDKTYQRFTVNTKTNLKMLL